MSKSFRKKLGQNTAEYLIMLTLVAVGTIGLVQVFGKQIRGKIGYVIGAMGGNVETVKNTKGINETAGKKSWDISKKEHTVKGIEEKELEDQFENSEGDATPEDG
jgi:Flp pilus assembly pilin Flp